LGLRIRNGLEIYVDPEIAGGEGFSHVTGMAGFPNGEITRVTSATPKPYLARAFIRQTWALGDTVEQMGGDANQLAGRQPVSRLTLTFGKMSVPDIFDTNTFSHDPRGQFLNWALMDNGAFDYPADTRGYTWGAALELNQRRWAVRVGSFLVPTYANGMPLDRHFRTNNGEVGEVELRPKLHGHYGKVKFLGYVNQANMGAYRLALQEMPVDPDVTLTRRPGTMKYGLGLNAEQALTSNVGAFLRLGWNDGKTESWEFTEIDRTGQAGLQWRGKSWRRPQDAVGVAGVINGLSCDHRHYLAAGGPGFIVGDGKLDYAAERILEAYYAWKPYRVFTVTLDFQFAGNPAFNRDRGPVPIWSLRFHWEV
jgi:high affinity Mn2+ porin